MDEKSFKCSETAEEDHVIRSKSLEKLLSGTYWRIFLSTSVSRVNNELSASVSFIVFVVFSVPHLTSPSSVLPGCSGCGQNGAPRSGNQPWQTWAADQAPLTTFDPQQAADPLVPLLPYASPYSTGQGERDCTSVGMFVSWEWVSPLYSVLNSETYGDNLFYHSQANTHGFSAVNWYHTLETACMQVWS